MEKIKAFPLLRTLLTMILIFAGTVIPSHAEDGWSFDLGASLFSESVYVGSDEMYVSPGLLANLKYSYGDVGFSLNLHEGPGMIYTNEEIGVQGSLKVAFDQERNNQTYSVFGRDEDHDADVRRLLEDTPTVTTDISPKLSLALPSRFGVFEASIAYHPTSVDYHIAGQIDRDYDGWLYALSYLKEMTVTETFSFAAMCELTYMNRDYAQAWFSVEYLTPSLTTYDAQEGLRDVALGFQATKMVSEQTGISLLLVGTYLLGEAADSPYTVERFQPSAMISTFYMF